MTINTPACLNSCTRHREGDKDRKIKRRRTHSSSSRASCAAEMRACGFLSLHAFCITATKQTTNAQRNIFKRCQKSHMASCAHKPKRMYCTCMSVRWLTGVSRPEVVWVAGKEGLMVLCWQVHVVVCQRLSTCYPRIPEHQRRDTFIISKCSNTHNDMKS